ncbi:MAG: DUF952 domain-containing protein [Halothece sp. Uz-M2-17]|nr:DUF952 domain-containing protein [Halothece sp. Uz-M2-17]
MMIFHITKRIEWEEAVRAGEYRAASLSDQGFIHCSTSEQMVRVANFLFAGQSGLVLLCIDVEKLNAKVEYENCEGGEDLFPHVYGSINLNAVVDVVDFNPDREGRFQFPEEIRQI